MRLSEPFGSLHICFPRCWRVQHAWRGFGVGNWAKGMLLWVPALPGFPDCSPCPSPNLPTRGKQRLAVSAPTLQGCRGVPATTLGLRGDLWAACGTYPPCTACVNCWSPGALTGWPAVGGWGSSAARLTLCGKSRGRASSCLAGVFLPQNVERCCWCSFLCPE